jgi:hypothetical protein
VFGARPGGILFGKPGAFMGAFAISALMHHVSFWGNGRGTEFATTGGIFLIMGVGTVMESAFTSVMGLPVRGWLGWSWTMLWMTLWGTFLLDAGARHGILSSEPIPTGLRPGKFVVDAIIALSSR